MLLLFSVVHCITAVFRRKAIGILLHSLHLLNQNAVATLFMRHIAASVLFFVISFVLCLFLSFLAFLFVLWVFRAKCGNLWNSSKTLARRRLTGLLFSRRLT